MMSLVIAKSFKNFEIEFISRQNLFSKKLRESIFIEINEILI
jgi:hypothetical protein